MAETFEKGGATMIVIRGSLKTGEWTVIDQYEDPRDVSMDAAALVLAKLILKGSGKTHETN